MTSITPEQIRELRDAYDDLSQADRASLTACFDGQAVMNNRLFWSLAGSTPDAIRLRLAHLIACFPGAEQLADPTGFRTGAMLRKALHPGQSTVEPAQAQRYRRLVAAKDIDELVPRMKKILQEADVPVDWGELGRDMFDWNEKVRERWDRDFYGTLQD